MVLPLKSVDGKLVLLVSTPPLRDGRSAMVWMAMGSDFVLVQGGGVRMVLGSGGEGIGIGYSDGRRKIKWREDQ